MSADHKNAADSKKVESPNARLMKIVKSVRTTQLEAYAAMTVYQKHVFTTVFPNQAPDVIDWNFHVEDRRRLITRHQQIDSVDLRKASFPMLSQIMSFMRKETWEGWVTCAAEKREFSSRAFFFALRSLLRAMLRGHLYVMWLQVRSVTAAEVAVDEVKSAMAGFLALCILDRDQFCKKSGGARKRRRNKRVLWLDIFNVFSDCQRYGVGQLVQASLCETAETTYKVNEIQLMSLEDAIPFWKSCGFRQCSQGTTFSKVIGTRADPNKRQRISDR